MICDDTSETDERLLLARLCQGDERVFAEVYRAHASRVLAVAQRVVVDRRAAEDVTQEVFTYLWRNPERVDLARGGLRTFLVMVARQRAVDTVRNEASRRNRHERVAQLSTSTADESTVDVADRLAASDLLSRRAAAVRAALERLPEAQRTSVQLAYFERRSYREVAQVMGVPEGTAKSRLRLALNRMADELPFGPSGAGADLVTLGRRAS